MRTVLPPGINTFRRGTGPRFDPQVSGSASTCSTCPGVCLGAAFLLCDELVSALDVSVAASILELLAKLAMEQRRRLAFVTHNMAVVCTFADRIAVMKDGIRRTRVERGSILSPQHLYTRELIGAVPDVTSIN
jgi:ABC-type glutathione transport system ATPase component